MTMKRVLTVMAVLLVIAGLGGGGYFVYAKMASPEVKLLKAFEALQKEEKVKIDSDFNMTLSFDQTSRETFDVEEEQQVYVDAMLDMLKNIEGDVSTLYDRKQKVMELDAMFHINGDMNGENVGVKLPFRMYLDEKAEEVAIDLDVYPKLLQDLTDILLNHVYLNTPEGEELTRVMEEEGMAVDGFVGGMKDAIIPVIEEAIQGAKYVSNFEDADLDLGEGKTYFGEHHIWGTFVGKEVMKYLQEKTEGKYISSENDWINLSVKNDMLVRAYMHALKEMKEDKEAKAHFEDDMSITLDEAIENLEEILFESDDEVEIEHELAFKLVDSKIAETKYSAVFSSEKDGHETTGTMSVESVYTYGDVNFQFHSEEREALNQSDMEATFEEAENEIEGRMEAVLTEFMKEKAETNAAEIEAAFKENMTDEEFQAFIAALEANEVVGSDLDLTEEEMYYFVLELEYAGFVREGTVELYMYE
ncbi:hypothetical protein NSQ26_13000 [Bacillus sp. FSL W7-1360]